MGRIFFDHNALVYISYLLVIGTWFWLFRTRAGQAHRAIGERPESAYARGTRVNFQRYAYTLVGGALVGMAGAAYSLSVRVGWTTPPSMLGDGWIALAIVIFGGWHPARVMLGAHEHLLANGGDESFWESGWLRHEAERWRRAVESDGR